MSGSSAFDYFKASMADTVAACETRLHPSLIASLREEEAFLHDWNRREAEALQSHRQRQVDRLADQASKQKRSDQAVRDQIREMAGTAGTAGKGVTHDQFADLICRIPLYDFDSLFKIIDMLPSWYAKRLGWINGQINWTTSKGKPAYFNKVNATGIPVAQRMAILASIIDVENDHGEGDWIDPILTCGLFPRKKGRHRFVRHCQELDFCLKCTWANINNGIDKLQRAYDNEAFATGGNFFAITIAPRIRKSRDGRCAAAHGGPLTKADWEVVNPDSVVFGEVHQPKVFEYPPDYYGGDALDEFTVEHKIRCFMGAAQKALQLLVRNHRCDGVRGKAEVALDFLPYRAHWHWHALASSVVESDAQKLADFLKREVDAILRKDRVGLVCSVEVRRIPTQEDLQKWVAYIYKPIDLLFPVLDFYDRHQCRPSRADMEQLLLELRLLRQRIKRTWKMKRLPHFPEEGKHTYRLQRSFAAGTHRFGKGSILYESRKDRERRLADRQGKRKRRSKNSASAQPGAKSP